MSVQKWISLLLTGVLVLGSFTSCTGAGNTTSTAPSAASEVPPAPKTMVRLAALQGPTSMGLVKLLADNEAGTTKNEYEFAMSGGTPDEIVAKLGKGEVDIAAVPCNLASVLYNNMQGKVKLLAVNTLGVLYIVESGNSIYNIGALRDKTIYIAGKGTVPEYALKYILTKNGMDPEKDVTLEYKSEVTEVAALLAEKSDTPIVAMLPEPFVTTAKMKNDSLRVALDLTLEWDKVGDSSTLITGVVVVRSDFLDENKAAVDAFLEEYKQSIEYVNINTSEAAQLVGKYGIVPAPVAEQALPACNIAFLEGAQMKEKVSGYLEVLFEQNPKSVGGKLPDDAFYYQK